MPEHTYQKPHKYVALADMYLHANNQLYTSNSFWDINF